VASQRNLNWAQLRRRHLEESPTCTYGDEPHFVPPSHGQVGFYLCAPPADLTNRSRETPEPPTDLMKAATTGPDHTERYVLLRFETAREARAFEYEMSLRPESRVVESTVVTAILQAMTDYGEEPR